MELLHALSKVHVGGKLHFDDLRFISLSASECEVLKAEAKQLVQGGSIALVSLLPKSASKKAF